jgi:hypothetical protein
MRTLSITVERLVGEGLTANFGAGFVTPFLRFQDKRIVGGLARLLVCFIGFSKSLGDLEQRCPDKVLECSPAVIPSRHFTSPSAHAGPRAAGRDAGRH